MTTGRERCPPCLREKPSGLFAAYPRQSPSAIMTSRGKSWLGWGCHQYARPSASTTGPIGQGCQCAPRPLSSRLAQHWLMDGEPTTAQVTERVVVDRLLRALPHPHRQAVSMRNPKTMLELAEAIELVEAAHRREAGERAPLWSRRVVQEQRTPEGITRPVDRPAVPSPRDEPMPTALSSNPTRTWLVGCVLHKDLPPEAPRAKVKINGRTFRALLDSGSAISLVQAHILPPRGEAKTLLPITCIHGDTRQVPARRVTISASPGTWPIEVGVVKELPVPVLLGRDWPGFETLLAAATQPTSQGVGRWGRRAGRKW